MATFRIVFLFLAALWSVFEASECFKRLEYCEGSKWIKFGDHCYLFRSTTGKRLSYYDAEDFCRSEGAHLVSIHSEEENNFLLQTSGDGGFGGRLWIGLNILSEKKAPLWSDGSDVDFLRNVSKEFYVNERCFMLMRSRGGWRPEHCSLLYSPICKRPAGATPTQIPPVTVPPVPVEGCPDNWIQFGDKCYKFFGKSESERKQFKQARDACWALGEGHGLVSIHSRQEQAFLTQHLQELGTSAWIGMRQVESDEIGHDIVFGWVDNSRTDFTFWAKGHPPPGTWKYCGRLSYEGVAKGEWVADYCEIEKRGYICQRSAVIEEKITVPEPSKCPIGFTRFREACYKSFAEPHTRVEAENVCQKQNGGHLLSIEDSFEQNFLINFANEEHTLLWTGLGTKENSRYLSWSDGTPFYFSNWAEPRVQLMDGHESCVALDPSNEMRWNITECTEKLPFICKISDDAAPVFPKILGTCPTDGSWIDIGDEFCYHMAESPNHVMSWDANARYCLTKGMKMIRLESNHQMKSLVAYFWKEFYGVHLGLLRTFDKKSFMWTDGSPFHYSNWAERQPSEPSSKREDCVSFDQSTGKWRTISCSDSGLVLCQTSKNVE